MKFLILVLLVVGCSFGKKSNEKADGHHQLYSSPSEDDVTKLATTERRLIIVSTNDLKGQLEAQQESAQDKHSPEKTLVSVGGAEIMARYLEILRSQYPSQVVLVDAGNALSGTLVSRSSGAKALVEMFGRLKYDALSLSSQDLAAGPTMKAPLSPSGWMPHLFKDQAVVLSNLLDLKTSKPVEWGKSTPQLLKEINEVKVGFIGLLPDDLPAKLDASVLNGLYVEPAMQAFLKQSRSLRLKGAEVIVLVMHGGIKCGVERAQDKGLPLAKVNFDPRDPKICDNDGALMRFVNELPPGSVDAVITGGGPGKVANFVNGVPVIQAFGQGTSFARVDLVWDVEKKALNSEKTKIHQPTRLCHRFFKETEDCFTEDSSIDHRQLVPARYLEKSIFPDPATAEWIKFWRDIMVTEGRPLMENDRVVDLKQEVAEAILQASSVDVAIVGGESWKLKLPQGITTWRDLYAQPSSRESIRLSTVTYAQLTELREKLQNAWWATKISWDELAKQESITLAVSSELWENQVIKNASFDHTRAPYVVADTLVSWERDTVNVRASGRSPALPHTQP